MSKIYFVIRVRECQNNQKGVSIITLVMKTQIGAKLKL
jgi:hypothetical protein